MRPLSPAAVAILSEVNHVDGSGYVFPGATGENYYQGTKRIWAKVRTMTKLPDVTPHTPRHTFGSTAMFGGEALALTGAILGHSNPRPTAIYNKGSSSINPNRDLGGKATPPGLLRPCARAGRNWSPRST